MGEQPMLLYTNTMQIRDTLTPDAFIALAIQWNQGSSWSENVIRGISWNGEHSVRFGTDEIWMAIEEYHGGEIIAVRYQKTDEDGTAWISDFVMDFVDWELTVRLYQNFPPDRPHKRRSTYFVPPYFPRLLIDHGYVLEDGPLPVAYEPILIRRENVSLLSDVITGEQQYRLPVVYVSRTTADEVPIKASDLAYQLKGAAHVMVQESASLDPLIRTVCRGKNTYHGAVGVYLPDGRHYRFFHGDEECPAGLFQRGVVLEGPTVAATEDMGFYSSGHSDGTAGSGTGRDCIGTACAGCQGRCCPDGSSATPDGEGTTGGCGWATGGAGTGETSRQPEGGCPSQEITSGADPESVLRQAVRRG